MSDIELFVEELIVVLMRIILWFTFLVVFPALAFLFY